VTAPADPRREILLLSLAAFASAASMRLVDAMLPRVGSEFQVGLSQAALAITVFSVAYGVTQVAFGPLGDRFGKLRVIALASIGAAVATLGCALAPGYAGFVAARLLAGALCGAIIPMSMAWIGDVVAYEHRQPVIARFLLGQITGLGCGGAVGGIAADQAAWRWPFAVIAAWLLVTGVMLLAASRSDPVPRRAGQGNLIELLRVLEVPWARVVLATVCVEGMLVVGAIAFVPTHLHESRGFALSRSGLALLAYAAGGLFFAIFARSIITRMGEIRLAVWGAILMSAGFGLVAWTPAWIVAPVGCLIAGLGFYMLHNTLQANATEMAPERRGAGMALFASMLFLGQSVGVGLAGLVAESDGALVPILFAAALILPLGLAFARARSRQMARSSVR
jgi:predicted MFS family arabinose efflux permease